MDPSRKTRFKDADREDNLSHLMQAYEMDSWRGEEYGVFTEKMLGQWSSFVNEACRQEGGPIWRVEVISAGRDIETQSTFGLFCAPVTKEYSYLLRS